MCKLSPYIIFLVSFITAYPYLRSRNDSAKRTGSFFIADRVAVIINNSAVAYRWSDPYKIHWP